MTKELTVTKENVPATTGFGGEGLEGIEQSDLVLPKLWLMQAISKLVAEEEKFVAGNIVNSLTAELVDADNTNGPIDVVPIMMKKVWYEYETVGNKEELSRIFDHGPTTASLTPGPVQGTALFLRRAIQFFVMISKEVEGGPALPAMMNFMKTNYQTGKKLITFTVQSGMLKQPIWGTAYQFAAKKQTNDHGTFYVWDLVGKRKATADESKASAEWYNILKASKVQQETASVDSTVGGDDIPF